MDRAGQIAVVFVSRRTGADDEGYGAAAQAMEHLASTQSGFRGFYGVKDADGVGIAVSYWADAASAKAWRDHPDHEAIRAAGRERWYDWYELTVSRVERGYKWARVKAPA